VNAIRADKDIVRGTITIAVLLLLAVLSFKTVIPKLLSGDTRETVTAHFADAAQLKVGDPVRVDGVKVGRVDSIERGSGQGAARVALSVNDDILPLHRDATAKVSIRGLLAGTFYVDLEPGTSPSGDLASNVISPKRTMGQIELEDVTSAFAGQARTGLTKLPGELAETFEDRRLPGRTLETLADVAPKVTDALRGVRGQELDEDLKKMIAASAKTARGFDAPRDELRVLVSGAAATLQTTNARADDLRFIFDQSPAIQRRVRTTLTRLSTTLDRTDPLVSALRKSARDLEPTFASFRQPIQDTDALLRSATPLLRALRPASRAIARASKSGDPALDGLDPSLDRLADTILPYMNKTQEETQLTPAQAVGPFFSSWGGAAAQTDANGHMFRFPASGGEGFVSNDLFCRTHLTNPTAAALVACDSLGDALNTFLTYSPSKVPGADGPPGARGGSAKRGGG